MTAAAQNPVNPAQSLKIDATLLRTAARLLFAFAALHLIVAELAYLIFGWPEILRAPTGQLMERFAADGRLLSIVYYLFSACWMIFLPIPIMLAAAVRPIRASITVGAVFGAFAAFCHAVGSARWVFVVPTIIASHQMNSDAAQVLQSEYAFEVQHQLAGVMIGEHFGNVFRAIWTLCFIVGAVAVLKPTTRVFGLIAGFLLLLVAVEQFGEQFHVLTPLIGPGQLFWLIWIIFVARDLTNLARSHGGAVKKP
jgi:hypothetical protein